MRLSVLAMSAVFALSAGAASAQWDADSQTELSTQGTTLRPGDYRQLVDFQPSVPVTVVVDIPSQLAGVYQQDHLVAVTTVSTGKPGHETPTGTFRVMGKAVDHHSNLYNNAAMPYMQRLTSDGVSIHAGKIPGTPASHGCVRMPLAMAKLLYGMTTVGTVVTIINDQTPPAELETAALARVLPAATSGTPLLPARPSDAIFAYASPVGVR
jgi:lipoprotein-anchoring transpeptidase ErfK/SrfK